MSRKLSKANLSGSSMMGSQTIPDRLSNPIPQGKAQLAPVQAVRVPNTLSKIQRRKQSVSPLFADEDSTDQLYGAELEAAEECVRGLRRDILAMQEFIDVHSSKNMLSYDMRRLETELLGISGPADKQSVKLLSVLKRKSNEVSDLVMGIPHTSVANTSGTTPQPGAQPWEANPGVAASTPVVAPLLELAKILKSAAAMQSAPYDEEQMDTDNIIPGTGIVPLAASTEAIAELMNASKHATPRSRSRSPRNFNPSRSPGKGSQSLNATTNDQQLPSAQISVTDPHLASSVARTGNASQSQAPVATPPTPKPLSADSLGHLRALGVELSPEDAKNPDINGIVSRLSFIARNVVSAQGKIDRRLQENKEQRVLQQRQMQLELDSLVHKLREKDAELQDLKRQLSSSRFAMNQQKSLTTAKDAPMSFEVERQYQRELHRAQLRIAEQESRYQQLLEDGANDRQRVKDMTAESAQLREEIARMSRLVVKLEEEKDESKNLFMGVSRTRGEEAKMCANAVKQLENRVGGLQEELQHERIVTENLRTNLTAAVASWTANMAEHERVQEDFDSLEAEYTDYKEIYGRELMKRFENTQRQLLKVYARCDEQEGSITVMKRRIEDYEHEKQLTTQETTNLLEKLKSSTEFKLLGVRLPEETKQLAVRLVMLTTDKDKREGSAMAQHAERLAIYKIRAEKEVVERGERRAAEADMISVDAKERELQQRAVTRESAKMHSEEHTRTNGRPPKESVVDEYVDTCDGRIVTFAKYYEERYPQAM